MKKKCGLALAALAALAFSSSGVFADDVTFAGQKGVYVTSELVQIVNPEPIFVNSTRLGQVFGTTCKTAPGSTVEGIGTEDLRTVLVRYTAVTDEGPDYCLGKTLFFVDMSSFEELVTNQAKRDVVKKLLAGEKTPGT